VGDEISAERKRPEEFSFYLKKNAVRETIDVYSENNTKPINTLYG
jgi:hypothetical protein